MKDFIRVVAAVPPVKIADCAVNEASIEDFFSRSAEKGADAVVFPELCLTGATCGDVFLSPRLLKAAERALEKFAAFTAHSPGVAAVVGLPLRVDGRIYDCAAVVESGAVKGFVPKSVVSSSSDGRIGFLVITLPLLFFPHMQTGKEGGQVQGFSFSLNFTFTILSSNE